MLMKEETDLPRNGSNNPFTAECFSLRKNVMSTVVLSILQLRACNTSTILDQSRLYMMHVTVFTAH